MMSNNVFEKLNNNDFKEILVSDGKLTVPGIFAVLIGTIKALEILNDMHLED